MVMLVTTRHFVGVSATGVNSGGTAMYSHLALPLCLSQLMSNPGWAGLDAFAGLDMLM